MELLRCTFGGCEAYSYSVQSYTGAMLVGIANAVAREFVRYRLLVPREVVRDRNMGRSEVRAVPAEGPMQADFSCIRSVYRLTNIWHGRRRVCE